MPALNLTGWSEWRHDSCQPGQACNTEKEEMDLLAMLCFCFALYSWRFPRVFLLPVFVNNGVKQPPIPPRCCEVVAPYADISVRNLLGPEQQPFLGCHVLGLPCHMDLRDLPENKL